MIINIKTIDDEYILTLHNIYYTHIYIAILGGYREALFSLKYYIYWGFKWIMKVC